MKRKLKIKIFDAWLSIHIWWHASDIQGCCCQLLSQSSPTDGQNFSNQLNSSDTICQYSGQTPGCWLLSPRVCGLSAGPRCCWSPPRRRGWCRGRPDSPRLSWPRWPPPGARRDLQLHQELEMRFSGWEHSTTVTFPTFGLCWYFLEVSNGQSVGDGGQGSHAGNLGLLCDCSQHLVLHPHWKQKISPSVSISFQPN